MTFKVFFLAVLCLSSIITQTNAECFLRTSNYGAIQPMFFRNYESATSIITNTTQGIRLEDDEKIIGHCKTNFVNAHSSDSDITISCDSEELYIQDGYGVNKPLSLIFDCSPGDIEGRCNIEFPTDTAVGPKLFKKVGTKTIQVIPETQMTIQYAQEIIANCEAKFKRPDHEGTELNLICLSGQMIALGLPYRTKHRYFECEFLKWNLYESSTQFPWCPSSMASYLLARPSAQGGVYEYLAGICYDIKQISFKSVYYAAKANLEKYLSPRILDSFKPLVEIKHIEENFISTKTHTYKNAQTGMWVSFSTFKNGSIIQNPIFFYEMFQPFNQLLNIDWWPGLQGGNWLRYEKALTKHVQIENNEYDILAGVSNAVAVPIYKEKCSKNLTMVDVIDTGNNKLPLYVWNYLKSLTNSSSDVVVIGVNTPFADFYDEKELIICEDICHKIDWLENTRLTFRYRPLGIIFCCNVDDVVKSDRLDGFSVPAEPITPTPLPHLNLNYFFGDETTVHSEILNRDYDGNENLY